jgi:hyaluronan synthase
MPSKRGFVAPILLWLVLFLCLLISVVKYLMGLILRLSFPAAMIRKDYTWQPTVSVLLPCYNEGETVYRTIREHQPEQLPERAL